MVGTGVGFQTGLLTVTALMLVAVGGIYTLWAPPSTLVGAGPGSRTLIVPAPDPGRADHTHHAQLQHTHHQLGLEDLDHDRAGHPSVPSPAADGDASTSTITRSAAAAAAAARDRAPPPQLQRQQLSAETPAMPPRVVVVTEVAEPILFESYFAGLLHASWQLQRDIAAGSRTATATGVAAPAAVRLPAPAEQPVHSVDIWAFCEIGACANMPPGCREVEYGADTPDPDPAAGACWFSFLPADYVAMSVARSRGTTGGRFTGEIFLTSIVFLTLEPALHSLKGYDYALRTDTDAILGHGLYQWVPDHAAFGWGWMGEPKTAYKWLEEAAARLKLEHHEVHAMQSTFFLEQKLIAPFAAALVNLTGHFISDEFTKERCTEKRGSATWLATEWHATDPCKWPHWHKGVSTLYAQNIAVNGILPKHGVTPVQTMVTERMDFSIGAPDPYNNEFPFDKIVQVHMVNCRFKKECTTMSKLHADYAQARAAAAGGASGAARGRGNRSRSYIDDPSSYTVPAASAVCVAATAEYAEFSTATPPNLRNLQPVPPNSWPQYGRFASARFFGQVCGPAS